MGTQKKRRGSKKSIISESSKRNHANNLSKESKITYFGLIWQSPIEFSGMFLVEKDDLKEKKRISLGKLGFDSE